MIGRYEVLRSQLVGLWLIYWQEFGLYQSIVLAPKTEPNQYEANVSKDQKSST